MPIKKCKTPKGKSGFKYGDSGKCYSDRSKAVKQAQAIKASQARAKKKGK
jgi:hypothetical protein